jgi:hypothetical protein
MKKACISLFLLTQALFIFVPPKAAIASKDDSCNAVIHSQVANLIGNTNINISAQSRRVDKMYKNYPSGRVNSMVIKMPISSLNKDRSKQDYFRRQAILNSLKLQQSVAEKIIRSCASISLVQFETHSSEMLVYGLMSDKTVQGFQCSDLAPYRSIRESLPSLAWGEVYCI